MSKIEEFQKRPVVIQAMHFVMKGHSGTSNYPELIQWITENGAKCFPRPPRQIIIETLEGNMVAQINDWIIRGVKGEFYPCKPDIFEATYQKPQPDELRALLAEQAAWREKVNQIRPFILGLESMALHARLQNGAGTWFAYPAQNAQQLKEKFDELEKPQSILNEGEQG